MEKANNNNKHIEETIWENKICIETVVLSRITAMIVHDIKNPLNNILLTCSAMEEMQLQDEQKDCVELIRRNSNRINTLMNELSMATTDLRLNLQPVNIHTLLEEVLRSVKGSNRFNDIVVHGNYEINVPQQFVDAALMEKALFNVVVNAFEAVDEKKGIVTITTKTTDGENCVIEVQDNGSGIVENSEAEIFEPCFSSKPGRNGLGLTIAKNVLQQHNGSLSLLKTSIEGSLFVIRLNNTKKTAV